MSCRRFHRWAARQAQPPRARRRRRRSPSAIRSHRCSRRWRQRRHSRRGSGSGPCQRRRRRFEAIQAVNARPDCRGAVCGTPAAVSLQVATGFAIRPGSEQSIVAGAFAQCVVTDVVLGWLIRLIHRWSVVNVLSEFCSAAPYAGSPAAQQGGPVAAGPLATGPSGATASNAAAVDAQQPHPQQHQPQPKPRVTAAAYKALLASMGPPPAAADAAPPVGPSAAPAAAALQPQGQAPAAALPQNPGGRGGGRKQQPGRGRGRVPAGEHTHCIALSARLLRLEECAIACWTPDGASALECW